MQECECAQNVLACDQPVLILANLSKGSASSEVIAQNQFVQPDTTSAGNLGSQRKFGAWNW